jgi:hypothetical protein
MDVVYKRMIAVYPNHIFFLMLCGYGYFSFSGGRVLLLQTLFLFISFVTAISISDLGKVFAVVGATGGILVTFIFPGMFYWKMFGSSTEYRETALFAFLFMCVGIVLVPVCLVALFC